MRRFIIFIVIFLFVYLIKTILKNKPRKTKNTIIGEQKKRKININSRNIVDGQFKEIKKERK